LDEAPQRVELPVKGKNDFEKFKNFGRMIYSPCVIIADFEADNKKCDENYGGKMRKIMEQKANSFCYMVHWIDTNETWNPVLYRGLNATEEFVRRLDKELRCINEVLEVKANRIITEADKQKFSHTDKCWICNGEFTNVNNKQSIADLTVFYEDLKKKMKTIKKDSEEYLLCLKRIKKHLMNKRRYVNIIRFGITVILQVSFVVRRIILVISSSKSRHGRPLSL
jgi:hypothetical protein